MVKLDRQDEFLGKLPSFGEHRAHVAMRQFVPAELDARDLRVILSLVEQRDILQAEGAIQRDHADVLEQRGEKDLVGEVLAGFGGDELGGDRTVQPATPVADVIKAGFIRFPDGFDKRKPERQGLHRRHPQDDQRLVNRVALAPQAVKTRIDRANDLRSQSLVILNRLGQDFQTEIGVAAEFDDLDCDSRERRKGRATQNSVKCLGIHPWLRIPSVGSEIVVGPSHVLATIDKNRSAWR